MISVGVELAGPDAGDGVVGYGDESQASALVCGASIVEAEVVVIEARLSTAFGEVVEVFRDDVKEEGVVDVLWKAGLFCIE